MSAQPALSAPVRLRCAVIGDPHLEEKTFARYLPIWDAMVDRVEAAAPDLIIVLGDIAGGRDTRHVWTLAERQEIAPRLRRLSGICQVVILAGNHDHPQELGWIPSLSSRPQGIAVCQDPGVLRFRLASGGSVFLYAVPYPSKAALLKGKVYPTTEEERDVMNAALAERLARFRAYVEELREDHPRAPIIVATHATWSGALPGGGEVFQPGGDVTVQPAALAALGADLVVGGHIHQPAQHWDRGFLAGSFYQGGHGEGGNDRYWWLFDFVEGAGQGAGMLSSLPATADRLGLEVYRYPTGAPRLETIRMRWTGEVLEGPEDFRPEHYVGVQLRVIVEADEEHEGSIPWAALDQIFIDSGTGDPLDWTPEKRINRAVREARAASLETATTATEKLLAWAEATGVKVDEERRKRLHDRIEGDARDVASTLAAAHPRLGELIAFATRRES